mmetsp:Transcript_18297/g.37749  ORF Transcript_18297/g.37749 Transcript_18297/m.37749 type:complete len:307 (+) Transcript_18297:802-1722(+)
MLSVGDDGGHLFGDDDTIGGSEHIKGDRVEGDTKFFGNKGSTSGNGNILCVFTPSVTETRGLDGNDIKNSTHLVDNKGRESLAGDIFGNDEKGFLRFYQLFQNRDNIVDIVDLCVGDQDSWVDQFTDLTFLILYEIRRNVSTIDGKTLGEFDLIKQGLGFFDNSGSGLSDLIGSLGDDTSHFNGSRGDGSNILQIINTGNRFGKPLDFVRNNCCGLANTSVEGDGVDTGSDGTHTIVCNGLCHDCGSGGTISGFGVTLLGDFLDQFGSNVFFRISENNFTGNGNSIVDNFGSSVITFEDNVSSLGT